MPINTAVVAEYLSLRAQQPDKPTRADFHRLNALMLQLAMELPVEVWRGIMSGLETGTVAGVFDAVASVREATNADGPIASDDIRWHMAMPPKQI